MGNTRSKALAYVQPLETYWCHRPAGPTPGRAGGPVGRYPLDYTPRLVDGHYDRFDSRGVPLRPSPYGGKFHPTTTVASHALAHWDRYLASGGAEHRRVVIATADHFAAIPRRDAEGGILLGVPTPTDPNGGHLSAMSQGHAISVLVRAAQLEDTDRYLWAARACLTPFTRGLDDEGVVGIVSANGAVWYEECATRPLRHVLNGMIYALWGLNDLAVATGDELASELYETGLDSVRRSLPLFDLGWWSRYWVPEDELEYVVSMMYHNLHAVMLTALHEQTGIEEFGQYERRFRRQARWPHNRLRAGLRLYLDKRALAADRARREANGSGAEDAGTPAPFSDPAARPRVGLLVGGYPSSDHPNHGVVNQRLAHALSDGARVTVFQPRGMRPGRPTVEDTLDGPVRVIRFAIPQLPGSLVSKLPGPLLIANLLLGHLIGGRILRQQIGRFDILHSVNIAFAGILGSLWAKRAGVPHVTQLVGTDWNIHFPRIRRWWPASRIHRWLHGALCNSTVLEREFAAAYPSVRPVVTRYRGIDLEAFSPEIEPWPVMMDRPGPRVLFLGGFPVYSGGKRARDLKGGETLTKAWERIDADDSAPAATLFLAGPSSDQPEVHVWRKRLRHPERVVVLGVLEPVQVPAAMRAADLYALPSLAEGLPNVAVEASACGTAVLASDVGGTPEIVQDGSTGRLLPPGDVDAWSAALRELLDDPERLHAWGRAAREYVECYFDEREYGPSVLEFYDSVDVRRHPDRPHSRAGVNPEMTFHCNEEYTP